MVRERARYNGERTSRNGNHGDPSGRLTYFHASSLVVEE